METQETTKSNVQVSTRVPVEIRDKANAVLAEQGLDLPTAYRIFTFKIAKEKRIPMRIDEPIPARTGGARIDGSRVVSLPIVDGHAVWPKELDDPEDDLYDQLYSDLL